MKKRLISMLLLVVMVLGMLPATALAASSEEEVLGEVNIYNGEQKLSYLSINGRIRELIYTYFNYVGANGKTKEIPAYCVNPNTKGVPQTVAPGQSIKYMAKEKGSDPKVMGIIANGYPTRGLSELKLENKYHAYYATKMALWCYLLPNWNINNLKVNPNLTGTELQRAQAILAAAKDIYVRGTAWSKVYSPRVTATADRDTAYAVTVNGQQYKQQVFTVHSDTWVCNYAIRVSFSDPGSVPDGTRIVDMDNKEGHCHHHHLRHWGRLRRQIQGAVPRLCGGRQDRQRPAFLYHRCLQIRCVLCHLRGGQQIRPASELYVRHRPHYHNETVHIQ